MEKFMLPCLNKKFFGFECPGCGGQRALVSLIKGDFTEAFLYYPAIYPLTALGLMMLVHTFYPIKYYSKTTSALAIFSVAVILINYTLKFLS